MNKFLKHIKIIKKCCEIKIHNKNNQVKNFKIIYS